MIKLTLKSRLYLRPIVLYHDGWEPFSRSLIMDEGGKRMEIVDKIPFTSEDDPERFRTEVVKMSKRLEKAFTVAAVEKILQLDSIPRTDENVFYFDGTSYELEVTKDDVTKTYNFGDGEVDSVPLIKYFAKCKNL